MIGQSNRFAHAAAFAVSESPAQAYNPLFIYGDSGLGKTHLLHAIGHYAKHLFPSLRVRYVNSEEFTNDFINSIRDDEGSSFKQIYRNVDMLLIDDIQFLAGKEHTQEEFFHTFNELIDKTRQIIMTCDRYPKEIEGLEARLKSRFGAGLTVSIRAPEPETRFAILKSKAKEQNFPLPDDVAYFIAENIESNVRDLEGALKKVIFQCQVLKKNEPATVPIAQAALADLLQAQKKQTSVENIQRVVAQYFGISEAELLSSSRKKTFVEPRMIAMALTRDLTDMVLQSVAEAFNRKDHTTVKHATESVESRKKTDPRFREEYENIKTIITA